MVRYRRHFLPGGTYFFTITLRDRTASTLTENIPILRAAFRDTRRALPFRMDAICILPDHVHMLCTLPEGDADYPSRIRRIKSYVSRTLGFSPWQSRYWEHTIRDDDDFRHHADYTHYNPVHHGLVSDALDWPYTSLHRVARMEAKP